ncbi:MAG: cysteine-rich CWC family protein [Azoarcus sp.]|jgi:hypothetical protein|nr:cysteine-rich CWC family protein [Azoarcus sp.]
MDMNERGDGLPPCGEQTVEMKTCPRCGRRFACGARMGRCWCAELPPLLEAPTDGEGCYCPDCLGMFIARQR